MLDYDAIKALSAVIETQSFQKAAHYLCLTQSAVSQRIKNLENFYGVPVIIRTHPYTPTPLGIALLGHLKRVSLLEESLRDELTATSHARAISIAISRDSIETWFTHIIDHLTALMPFTLDIIADDQEATLDYLQKGHVSACASTQAKSPSGCKAEFLGFFDYVLVAAPEFKRQYFHSKADFTQALVQAPSIIFDQKDTLHADYLRHYFGIDNEEINCHVIPSVAGFKQFTLKGYAYALIPEIDIARELAEKRLINLCPDKTWKMPVYWHSWAIETRALKQFNRLVVQTAKKILRQS